MTEPAPEQPENGMLASVARNINELLVHVKEIKDRLKVLEEDQEANKKAQADVILEQAKMILKLHMQASSLQEELTAMKQKAPNPAVLAAVAPSHRQAALWAAAPPPNLQRNAFTPAATTTTPESRKRKDRPEEDPATMPSGKKKSFSKIKMPNRNVPVLDNVIAISVAWRGSQGKKLAGLGIPQAMREEKGYDFCMYMKPCLELIDFVATDLEIDMLLNPSDELRFGSIAQRLVDQAMVKMWELEGRESSEQKSEKQSLLHPTVVSLGRRIMRLKKLIYDSGSYISSPKPAKVGQTRLKEHAELVEDARKAGNSHMIDEFTLRFGLGSKKVDITSLDEDQVTQETVE